MIQIIQGFKVSTRDAVDNRILLSKAEMRAVNDNQMPEKYFAICKDDGKLYLYDKSRLLLPMNDEGTGKFYLYSEAAISSISVDGEILPIDELKNIDLPLATAEKYGLVKIGKGLAVEEGGMLSIDFNSVDDGSIPPEKIDWSYSVIDGSNININ